MHTPAAKRITHPCRYMKRKLIASVLVAVALGSVALYATTPASAIYETAVIGRGDIESTVTAVGTLQPSRYVEVGAQVSGQINRLLVQAGDVVTKGQLLAEIDPRVPQATVEAGRAALAGLKAQLAEQQAQLELARHQYERQQLMAKDGSTRDEDVQIAAATLKSAAARIDNLKAQVQQTQSTLDRDKTQLEYTRIYAPIAGTVISVDVKEGQTLNATYQTPIMLRIADLSVMTVWAEVSEADVRRVKPGVPVYFTTLGGDGRRWTSKVRQVLPAPPTPPGEAGTDGKGSSSPANKVVLYTVLFDVENSDRELMPQMTAQSSFVIASAKNVLVAPLVGLSATEGKPGSYRGRILVDSRIDEREVRIGVRNRLNGEVLDGLKESEQLITGEREADDRERRFEL
jgi:membrane fusion protein, macrolide-specific efflux system